MYIMLRGLKHIFTSLCCILGMTIVTKSSPVTDDPKQVPPQALNPDVGPMPGPSPVSPPVSSGSDQPANPSSPESQPSEAEGIAVLSHQLEDGQEPEFPHAEMARLDEMINRPRWVVPVLHNGELEILLDAVIDLCKKGKILRTIFHICRKCTTVNHCYCEYVDYSEQ